jgi:hypothetical protein
MKTVRALLLTAALVLSATKATATEECVGSMAELNSSPELQRILVSFGGHENLAGFWKLSGLAGSFVQAKVQFDNRETSFWTDYNSEGATQISVCTADDQVTLKLVVAEPRDPNNKMMFVRAVPGQPDKILIAAFASKWKFVKFKRVQTIRESTQMEFARF